jgi:hypothetical protein
MTWIYCAPSRDSLRQALFTLCTIVVLFVLTVAYLRPASNWMPVRTLIVVSGALFVAYPFRLRQQLWAWSVLAAGTVALLWLHYTTMSGVERFSVRSNFVLAGVLGLVVARNRWALEADVDESMAREHAAIEDRERAASELKRLEGIIPICAYCHQVRTEAGAWEQLEEYVRSGRAPAGATALSPRCRAPAFHREASAWRGRRQTLPAGSRGKGSAKR